MKKDVFFVITLGILLAVSIPLFHPGKGEGDFLTYWSAAHLFVHGGNPYDQNEMYSLQQQSDPERYSDTNGLNTAWNPPWLILILLPIGILPFSIAVPAWIFCNTFLIGMALLISWKLCVGDQKSRGILLVYLAGFLFVETLSYLAIGQITSLVLLGFVIVVWSMDHDMDLLAGAALLITTIKPHISYFFIILVFIWVIQNHRWKVVLGFISTAAVSMVIFWIAIPNWLSMYIDLIGSLPYSNLFSSTIGSFIYEKFNISIFSYSAILLIFLIKPILQLIKKEGWLTATNLALLISIPFSPYGFNFDHIVILPVFVQLIAWSVIDEISRKTKIFVAVSLIILNLILMKMISIDQLEYYWFFWIPILLLGIFLIARKMRYVSSKFTN